MRYAARSAAGIAFAAALALSAAACDNDPSGNNAGSGSAGKGAPIGVDLPRADSDFWNSYAKYVPQYGTEYGINLMTPTNSQNDVAKLVANTQALVSQGAKAIVMAPQDTGAIASTLATLESKKIPVVSVDTRPD